MVAVASEIRGDGLVHGNGTRTTQLPTDGLLAGEQSTCRCRDPAYPHRSLEPVETTQTGEHMVYALIGSKRITQPGRILRVVCDMALEQDILPSGKLACRMIS